MAAWGCRLGDGLWGVGLAPTPASLQPHQPPSAALLDEKGADNGAWLDLRQSARVCFILRGWKCNLWPVAWEKIKVKERRHLTCKFFWSQRQTPLALFLFFRFIWLVFLCFYFLVRQSCCTRVWNWAPPLVWPKCQGFKRMRVLVVPPFFLPTPLHQNPTPPSPLGLPPAWHGLLFVGWSADPWPLRLHGPPDLYRPRSESSISLTSQTSANTYTDTHRHLQRKTQNVHMWEWIKEYAQ